MTSDHQKVKAKVFISIVFEIVGESISAIPNYEEIKSLLTQADLTIEENQRFSGLFQQLASTVENDEETLAMIAEKLDEYKRRIYDALESEQIDFDPESFYKKPKS
jgi:uncharacterized protein with von Willebrand factor type A (vWA) domain